MEPDFGTELRKLRIAAAKTLKEAAEAMGNVSVPYISDIERGRRNPPPPDRIHLLLALYGAESQADRMTSLAAKVRGAVQIHTEDHDTREMLVALHRRIETQSLDQDLIRHIQDLLGQRRATK